ncbi:hypothetical protein [Butyrivibrio sp. NC3005]|uniref:hypothetical protein n=1 Tax=Butyrivibrio sp. NC3005 TaxID=1280685 RepID=UPI00040C7502|nr:hypothetical protein [Butyrivibrio sp. NC3005]
MSEIDNKKIKPLDIIAILITIVTVISILPIAYCSFHNYATGDDFVYGAVAKQAMRDGAGFVGIMQAIFKDMVFEYNHFQGTWSSGFLFRIVPVIVSEHFYRITTWIALVMLLGCSFIFIKNVFVKRFGLSFSAFVVIFDLLSIGLLQWAPYPRAAYFWYTGMIHYVFPFGIVLLCITACLNFLETGHRKFYIGLLIGMTYLGGAGYPEVVISLVSIFFITAWMLIIEKKRVKNVYLLALPIVIELIGFGISAAAPGNKVRGGEDFGFGPMRAIMAVVNSFKEGIVSNAKYFCDNKLLWVLVLATFVIVARTADNRAKNSRIFEHPVLILIMFYCLVSSVYAPQMYAGDVRSGYSGGVFDSYYYTFAIALILLTVYFAFYLKYKTSFFGFFNKKTLKVTVFAVSGLLFLLLSKKMVKTSLDYTCYQFVSSGQLEDFETQMKERLAILENEEIKDAVVPEMNDQQGPFMHFALMRDQDSYTNYATERFYGKNSVIAVPREEFEQKYGK